MVLAPCVRQGRGLVLTLRTRLDRGETAAFARGRSTLGAARLRPVDGGGTIDRPDRGFAGLSVPTFLPEILPAIEAGWRFDRQMSIPPTKKWGAVDALLFTIDHDGQDPAIGGH